MVIVCWILSFAICFCAMPAVIRLSWHIGAVDVPRDWRRMHCKSTPRAGGIAILSAFLVSCAVVVGESSDIRCAMGAGILMLILGLCDDILSFGAWLKLFFQAAIALAAVLSIGMTSPLSLFLSVLWVLLLGNAHNMIDGLDGLFAGCASIEGTALAVALMMCGFSVQAYASVILVGGCLAFLCFNRHPAHIFAGDCGSGTVGFLLGLLSLPLLRTGGGRFLAVLLIFAYPLTDLFTAVLRRTLRGQSPFVADRAHLHHRVYATGISVRGCVWVFRCLVLVLCTLGVLLVDMRFLPLSSLLCMGIAWLLMGLRRFILKFS